MKMQYINLARTGLFSKLSHLSGFSLNISISLWSNMFSSGSQVLYFGLQPFHFTRYSIFPFFIRFLFILSAANTISSRLFFSMFLLFSATIGWQFELIMPLVDFEYLNLNHTAALFSLQCVLSNDWPTGHFRSLTNGCCLSLFSAGVWGLSDLQGQHHATNPGTGSHSWNVIMKLEPKYFFHHYYSLSWTFRVLLQYPKITIRIYNKFVFVVIHK